MGQGREGKNESFTDWTIYDMWQDRNGDQSPTAQYSKVEQLDAAKLIPV